MRHALATRLAAQSGIALGPILFILAILAIIGGVLAAGSGGFNVAIISDRVAADVASQANLIRSKINECTLLYGSNTDYTTYPVALTPALVSAITCPGDSSRVLWTGSHPANLPPPTAGFNPWYYINTNGSGGTNKGACIYVEPTASSSGIVEGLTHAANKFTHAASNDGASEVNFDSTKTHKRFVVWISTPPAAAGEDANCTPQ